MKKTYTEIEQDIQTLLRQHDLSHIDFVVGISRGGLFPAMVVSTSLVKPLVVAYINKQDEVFFDRREWIAGKRILVVDDIVRTGKTLKKIKGLLGACESLVPYKLGGEADYGIEVTEDVTFPWDE